MIIISKLWKKFWAFIWNVSEHFKIGLGDCAPWVFEQMMGIKGHRVYQKTLNQSKIKEVKYYPHNTQLNITFTDDKSYVHLDVPKSIYDGLVTASSPGAFYNREIRGVFRYSDLN